MFPIIFSNIPVPSSKVHFILLCDRLQKFRRRIECFLIPFLNAIRLYFTYWKTHIAAIRHELHQ